MGNTSIQKMNFEDIQTILKENTNTPCLLINTLREDQQSCLLPKTVSFMKEESIVNQYIQTNKNIPIVVYGLHCNDASIYKKYNQLITLGFTQVSLYPGGMFEWLLLQDIYGEEDFPTTAKEYNLLRFKPPSSRMTEIDQL